MHNVFVLFRKVGLSVTTGNPFKCQWRLHEIEGHEVVYHKPPPVFFTLLPKHIPSLQEPQTSITKFDFGRVQQRST
jgi:hypothetical protein